MAHRKYKTDSPHRHSGYTVLMWAVGLVVITLLPCSLGCQSGVRTTTSIQGVSPYTKTDSNDTTAGCTLGRKLFTNQE